MVISSKGRYALRVMVDLAEHGGDGYVSMRDVARRQEISDKYAGQIMTLLSRAGLVDGVTGKGGGYRLTREPDQYTVGELLPLTEGSLAPVSCLAQGAAPCPRMSSCRTYEMWKGLDDLIEDYFGKITLADLAAPDEAVNDYVICRMSKRKSLPSAVIFLCGSNQETTAPLVSVLVTASIWATLVQ